MLPKGRLYCANGFDETPEIPKIFDIWIFKAGISEISRDPKTESKPESQNATSPTQQPNCIKIRLAHSYKSEHIFSRTCDPEKLSLNKYCPLGLIDWTQFLLSR